MLVCITDLHHAGPAGQGWLTGCSRLLLAPAHFLPFHLLILSWAQQEVCLGREGRSEGPPVPSGKKASPTATASPEPPPTPTEAAAMATMQARAVGRRGGTLVFALPGWR